MVIFFLYHNKRDNVFGDERKQPASRLTWNTESGPCVWLAREHLYSCSRISHNSYSAPWAFVRSTTHIYHTQIFLLLIGINTHYTYNMCTCLKHQNRNLKRAQCHLCCTVQCQLCPAARQPPCSDWVHTSSWNCQPSCPVQCLHITVQINVDMICYMGH